MSLLIDSLLETKRRQHVCEADGPDVFWSIQSHIRIATDNDWYRSIAPCSSIAFNSSKKLSWNGLWSWPRQEDYNARSASWCDMAQRCSNVLRTDLNWTFSSLTLVGATMATPPWLMKLVQSVFAAFSIGLECFRIWRPSARSFWILMASLSPCQEQRRRTCVPASLHSCRTASTLWFIERMLSVPKVKHCGWAGAWHWIFGRIMLRQGEVCGLIDDVVTPDNTAAGELLMKWLKAAKCRPTKWLQAAKCLSKP